MSQAKGGYVYFPVKDLSSLTSGYPSCNATHGHDVGPFVLPLWDLRQGTLLQKFLAAAIAVSNNLSFSVLESCFLPPTSMRPVGEPMIISRVKSQIVYDC